MSTETIARKKTPVHPFIIDLMKRRGMQDLLNSLGKSPEVVMLFDEKFRVKLRTFSPERISIYAAVCPVRRDHHKHTPFIRQVLSLSYMLYYKNSATLSIRTGTGMLVLSRDILAPQRSYDLEEALTVFINDLEFCIDQFRIFDAGHESSVPTPFLR